MSLPLKDFASRWCGCSFVHSRQSLAQGLQLARSFGFDTVDIGVGGANRHFDPIEVAQSPWYFAEEVRCETEKFDLLPNECFALNFGEPINTPDLEQRCRTVALFKGLCQFARQARFNSVMLLAGPIHQGLGPERSLDLAVEAYSELVEIAAEHNLQLNVEADSESCVHTPAAAEELCQRVPGLGLTLDYSHFISQGIEQGEVECLHPFTRHIHIRQAAPGQIVTDVESGTIDFARVLQSLNEAGYQGLFCIEYLSLNPTPQARQQAEDRTLAMHRELRRLSANPVL
jgi:sugar phosphate isomerase/epimerase